MRAIKTQVVNSYFFTGIRDDTHDVFSSTLVSDTALAIPLAIPMSQCLSVGACTLSQSRLRFGSTNPH